MKHLLLITFLINSLLLSAQLDKTIEFGGVQREYLEYVPEIYDGSEAVPLVICLHGLGDNKENFFGIGMNYIADTANFIVQVPEALNDVIFGQQTGNAWNSGASQYGIVINDDIDDVGFLTAMIDSAKSLYNIDDTKIFVTGFSMGGYMSNKLACELSGSIAAIASVSGTIGSALNCNPSNPISVCHFHGTADQTVNYTNNPSGMDAEPLVEYWRNHNNCDAVAVETSLPDNASDGKTVDHFFYGNGDENTTVEFYKINNGGHEWLSQPANDISYTIEIWKFFRKQGISVDIDRKEKALDKLEVFPNPSENIIHIQNLRTLNNTIEIYSSTGVLIKRMKSSKEKITLDVSGFEKGAYILSVNKQSKKLIIK